MHKLMVKQQTLLAGQVLQYRDKLHAKRHCVPCEFKDKWNNLLVQVDTLQPKINLQTQQKSIGFQGTLNDLKILLHALMMFDNKVVN